MTEVLIPIAGVDFEGSLPAAHNPALSTLLAPEASTDASQPPQVGGKRKAYQINQADVEEVKKVCSPRVAARNVELIRRADPSAGGIDTGSVRDLAYHRRREKDRQFAALPVILGRALTLFPGAAGLYGAAQGHHGGTCQAVEGDIKDPEGRGDGDPDGFRGGRYVPLLFV